MGCVLTKTVKERAAAASRNSRQQQRRPSWRARRFNKSTRMAEIRQREAAAAAAAAAGSMEGFSVYSATAAGPGPSSRRSSLANPSRGLHAVCPEPEYDFSSSKRDYPEDDYLCQLDCMREQKRNEFEDFGNSQHLTLGAFDRLEFDVTPMENGRDALF